MKKWFLIAACTISLLTACTEESTKQSTEQKEGAEATEEQESSLKLEKVQLAPDYGWENNFNAGSKIKSTVIDFVSRGMPQDQFDALVRTDGMSYYVLFDKKSPSYIEKVLDYVIEGTDISVKQLVMEMTTPNLFIHDYGLAKDNIAEFEPAGDFSKDARIITVQEDYAFAGIEFDFIVDGDNVILYYLGMPDTYIGGRNEQVFINNDITIEVDLLDLANRQPQLYNENAVKAMHIIRKAIQEERMNVVTNTLDEYLSEFSDAYRNVSDEEGYVNDEEIYYGVSEYLFGEKLYAEQLNYISSLYAQGKGNILENVSFTVQSFKPLADTTSFEVTTLEDFKIRHETQRITDGELFSRQVTYQLQYTYQLENNAGYVRPYVITGIKIH